MRDQKKIHPPKVADKLFEWYCNNNLAETIQGDLHERFHEDLEKYGKTKARIKYWLNILRFANRYTLRRSSGNGNRLNSWDMFKSNLLTSYRYLIKHQRYALINIFGLSVGLACCLLIFFFLRNELTYDHFNKDGENIYRITTKINWSSGDVAHYANTQPALAPGIRGLFPEIQKVSQLRYAMRTAFTRGEQTFYEDYGYYADSLFLEIFTFGLKEGDLETALDEPNTIVISEDLAQKYFGKPDPIGELLIMNHDRTLKVTGILEPIPNNSHIQFDFLISFSSYVIPDGYVSDLSSWTWLGFLTYVQLEPGADPDALTNKLDQLYKEKIDRPTVEFKSNVQALYDIYLGSNGMTDDLNSHLRTGNRNTTYALGLVAILILLIAGFNFMNLSAAISINRGKEISLRKILGANRLRVVVQLLTESMMVTLLSLNFAILWVAISAPYITRYLSLDFTLDWSLVAVYSPYFIIIALMLGVFAGLYPSLLLSRFDTILALKNNLKIGRGGGSHVRNGLVLIQFCISSGLIVSTMVISAQLRHMSNQSLGFDQENVIVMRMQPDDMTTNYSTLKNALRQNPHVINVSRSERLIGDPWPANSIRVEGEDENDLKQVLGNLVGFDYLETIGIKLKEGRDFIEGNPLDSLQTIILNEKAVAHLGLDEPIGKQVHFFSIAGPRTIIGVVEDFNFSTLHDEIVPMVLVMPFIDLEQMYVRVAPGNLAEQISSIEADWKNVALDVPMDFTFMDGHLDQLYHTERQLSYLIAAFSLLAILLACMGLFSLVSFMINNRLKEVGIRKVLGASVASSLILLSSKYVQLILIASLISFPVMHFVLNMWLDGFAYRIEISPWIYVFSCLLLLGTAVFIISRQAIKAALINPAQILRNE